MKVVTILVMVLLQDRILAERDQDHLRITSSVKGHEFRATDHEDKDYWFRDGQNDLSNQLLAQPRLTKAKNIVFFLADGTSMTTWTAARLFKGYRSGNYEREQAVWETLPYTGVYKTYNTDNVVTDSAASATAYLTGSKANQGTIGVDVNVHYGNCSQMLVEAYHTQSVLRDFQLDNRSTGIVTTTRVTHASPAGNFAHTAERHWENDDDMNDDDANLPDPDVCDDIAEQLVLGDTGSAIKVILGGGRRGFLPKEMTDEEGEEGKRDDGKNLINTWLTLHNVDSTALYVGTRSDLMTVDKSSTDYLLGLFDSSHMDYNVDNDGSNPTLEEMTQKALEILQKDTNGFFLFVEGGLIDKAHHLNEANNAMEEALQFEKAVAKAISMTSLNDTLIIVTADHGQPVAMNGYPPRNFDPKGLVYESDEDKMPYAFLMYTNGPGWRDRVNGERPNPENENWEDVHYVNDATVPMSKSYHNGEDVPLYAGGPNAHLFTGVHENAYIPQVMRYAACVGTGLSFCDPSEK